MPIAAHPKASFRGVVTCARAASMLVEARNLLITWGHAEIADGLWITQGSYRPPTSYSSRTHCGCGVVDVGHGHRVTGREWTDAEWWLIERALRAVGFAAWHRTPAQGNWPHHCHAVAGNCAELDPEAAVQWAAYLIGLNGLNGAGRARDDGPRDFVGVTWESYQVTAAATLPPHTDPDLQEEQMLYFTDENGTVYVGTSTRLEALSSMAEATAVAKARSGQRLTLAEVAMVRAVQARLREPAIATVTDAGGTVYAVTDRLVPLGSMTTVNALGAVKDGARITNDQAAAARVLG